MISEDACWFQQYGLMRDLRTIHRNRTHPTHLDPVESRLDLAEKLSENFVDSRGLTDASCEFLIHSKGYRNIKGSMEKFHSQRHSHLDPHLIFYDKNSKCQK